MADLRIGGLTIHLGDQVERTTKALTASALLAITEQWLNLAAHILPAEHPAILSMQDLVNDIRRKRKDQ